MGEFELGDGKGRARGLAGLRKPWPVNLLVFALFLGKS